MLRQMTDEELASQDCTTENDKKNKNSRVTVGLLLPQISKKQILIFAKQSQQAIVHVGYGFSAVSCEKCLLSVVRLDVRVANVHSTFDQLINESCSFDPAE